MFKVLSWNLSWGAMKGDPTSINDKSAQFLAYNKCYLEKPIPSCLDNVINYLKILDNNFHFIGLQEAYKSNYIFQELKKIKHFYNIIHTQLDHNELVTIYNNKIYNYISHHSFNINNEEGRPAHIILFQNYYYYYIIINLHNGHNNSKTILEKSLSDNFEYFNNNKLNNIFNDISINRIKVIILGDFNENIVAGIQKEYWKGLQPFKYLTNNFNTKSIINYLKNIIVNSNVPPPNTCCVGKSNLRTKLGDDQLIGDYILSNLNVIFELPDKNIFNYNANINPKSDHLPIIGIILDKKINIKF